MNLRDWLSQNPVWTWILVVLLVAAGAHFVARWIRRLSAWAVGADKERLEGQYPRFATITHWSSAS